MNPKLLLLRLFLDPAIWKQYREHVHTADDKHLNTLYGLLDGFLTKVDRTITLDEFKAVVEASNAFDRDKDREVYQQMIKVLEDCEVGTDIIKELLIQVKQRDLAEKLAIASFDFAEGKGSLTKLQSIYEKLNVVEEAEQEDPFVTDDLNELYEKTVGKSGLRWRLRSLNRILGSLRKGDFGFVFARPETGKTTFLASEISHFAEQTDAPILWINNEEQGSKVKTRVYQASLGMDLKQLMENRDESQRLFVERTKRNIRIFDRASIYRREIEKLCKQYQPSLVVIDQLDKIKGFDGDREDLKLGAIYQWARELAKEYCPVIAVCQADGSAEGVRWLNMGHVTSAKTTKQAEADFIIGIGKTNEQGMEKTRYINISKNKLQGDEDSDPQQRHGYFECIIEADIGRYRDIGDTL